MCSKIKGVANSVEQPGGQEANGSLALRLDQAIGVPTNGCQLTGLTLTPFGESQLAARFTEEQCEGGQMVMRRSAQ